MSCLQNSNYFYRFRNISELRVVNRMCRIKIESVSHLQLSLFNIFVNFIAR